MTYDAQRVGRRIKGLRADRGMTQLELATAAGISEATVANCETGRAVISLANALSIADALKTTLEVIVCRDELAGHTTEAA